MSFFEQLKIYADKTEKRFVSLSPVICPGRSDKLKEAMDYSFLNGGKRIRAYLTMEFCALYGEDPNKALDYACALEMIHAFSLIHDDLPAMDNDDMRRGKPSNHKAFGEATAILAGDSLALDAFKTAGRNAYCTDSQNVKAMILLSEKAGSMGMCSGQQFDIDGEGKRLGIDELKLLVDLKTCALFQCACMLGCIAADKDASYIIGAGEHVGKNKQRIFDAARFGLLCGRAFQITDDLLDIHSTPEELGKTVGKDVIQEKSTFVSLLGERKARKYAKECIKEAKDSLELFPENEAKNRLYEFCDYILERKK